jgi:hypothetical protein
MTRFGVSVFILASSVMMALDSAYGQVVQYQFSPPSPVVPLSSAQPSSGTLGLGVTRPVPDPAASVEPYVSPPSPGFVQVPGRAPVVVPPPLFGPRSSDGLTNCSQAGTAAGGSLQLSRSTMSLSPLA